MFRSVALLLVSEQMQALKQKWVRLGYDTQQMLTTITEMVGVVCNLHNEGYLIAKMGESHSPMEERVIVAIYRYILDLGLDKSVMSELMALSSRVCIELNAVGLSKDTREFRVEKITDSFVEISYATC